MVVEQIELAVVGSGPEPWVSLYTLTPGLAPGSVLLL